MAAHLKIAFDYDRNEKRGVSRRRRPFGDEYFIYTYIFRQLFTMYLIRAAILSRFPRNKRAALASFFFRP